MMQRPPRSTLFSLHDALPISSSGAKYNADAALRRAARSTPWLREILPARLIDGAQCTRSEEHTSELQSRVDLVCRLLLEKKNRRLHGRRSLRASPRAIRTARA